MVILSLNPHYNYIVLNCTTSVSNRNCVLLTIDHLHRQEWHFNNWPILILILIQTFWLFWIMKFSGLKHHQSFHPDVSGISLSPYQLLSKLKCCWWLGYYFSSISQSTQSPGSFFSPPQQQSPEHGRHYFNFLPQKTLPQPKLWPPWQLLHLLAWLAAVALVGEHFCWIDKE